MKLADLRARSSSKMREDFDQVVGAIVAERGISIAEAKTHEESGSLGKYQKR